MQNSPQKCPIKAPRFIRPLAQLGNEAPSLARRGVNIRDMSRPRLKIIDEVGTLAHATRRRIKLLSAHSSSIRL